MINTETYIYIPWKIYEENVTLIFGACSESVYLPHYDCVKVLFKDNEDATFFILKYGL